MEKDYGQKLSFKYEVNAEGKKITLHFSINPKERWVSTKLFIHSCYMHVAFSPEQSGKP